MFAFDPLYLLFALPGLLLSMWAQGVVKSTFNQYARLGTRSGLSGAEAAAQLAQARGAPVRIEGVDGFLADHYDPAANTLRLSPEVYHGRSISALGVAAHELGHALQKADNYFPMYLRSGLVPLASLGSQFSYLLILGGLFLHSEPLQNAGLVLFMAAVAFTLVTLPVEFDASARAMRLLRQGGLVTDQEAVGVQRVLTAAALTYVAGAVTAVLQLLYYLNLTRRDD